MLGSRDAEMLPGMQLIGTTSLTMACAATVAVVIASKPSNNDHIGMHVVIAHAIVYQFYLP